MFPLCVCSLHLFPAKGIPVPRKALHFRELSVFLLVGDAEGHEGKRTRLPAPRVTSRLESRLCTRLTGDDSHGQRQAGEEALHIHGVCPDC